jgi:hypothetical protein
VVCVLVTMKESVCFCLVVVHFSEWHCHEDNLEKRQKGNNESFNTI